MPTTPIKSTIAAPPTSKDVSAIIRSIRGSFVNMNSDQSSRLQVALPALVVNYPNINEADVSVGANPSCGLPTFNLTSPDAGLDVDVSFSSLGLASFTIDGVQEGDGFLYTNHRFVGPVGSTLLYSIKVGFTNPTDSFINTCNQRVGIGIYNEPGSEAIEPAAGFFLKRTVVVSAPGVLSYSMSISYSFSGVFTDIQQADWNIDTVMTSADIAKNPSRVQINFDYPIELNIYAEFPNSLVFGFTYDGVFLPVHRLYIEDSGGISEVSTQYSVMWWNTISSDSVELLNISTYIYGFSVHILGESVDRLYPASRTVTSSLINVAPGAEVGIISAYPVRDADPGIASYQPTPELQSVNVYTSGPAIVRVGGDATFAAAGVAVSSGSNGYNIEGTENLGAIDRLGGTIIAVPCSGNVSISDFDRHRYMGFWYADTPAPYQFRDTRFVSVKNVGSDTIQVMASMTFGFPY